jgi:hypothetical protein
MFETVVAAPYASKNSPKKGNGDFLKCKKIKKKLSICQE